MIRCLFVAVMVVSGTLAFAHEGETCKCHQGAETLSFREEALSDFFPLTREVMETMLHADEWGLKVARGYKLESPRAVIISIPPMRPQHPLPELKKPALYSPAPRDIQSMPSHLAFS